MKEKFYKFRSFLQNRKVTDYITKLRKESEEVKNSEKIETVSVVPLLGEAIKRISEERSVSSLFD